MSAVRPDEIAPVNLELSSMEARWLARQQKKALRAKGSKYVVHQGTRERQRRLRQRLETR